ncbi:CPBP family intramembrane glutamic endopeptidase [Leptodesmis sichuanensis]|uniref:CPBP family intramembrane glutamic endopeptidase n=1 Tax=Leptodesmis sichuanensis TaxID=2906798 RepID=UPI001F1D1A7B|nr:CPBP family intramembrane glutamic endopeptidase [Leptodesmis sichuanensis]UIE37162.1 CPBP family intramembrane metalloprotease [Leptodesmis sichuanensis A121]
MKPDFANVRHYPAPLRLVIFALILVALWLPIALPAYLLIRDRNLVSILTLLVLYAEFLWLVQQWGRVVHQDSRILNHYGLEWSRRNGMELLAGFAIAVFSVLLLMGLQTILGWVTWKAAAPNLARIILEGLLVSLALGFAEELLFRGWILDELQRDYIPTVALWGNAIIFAALHLRLLTLPALVLLGVALVWAKRSRGEWQLGRRRDRLGLPIGLHAGLVWSNYILEVGQLITYTGRVPTWVTGIDRNPLQGLVGIVLLGFLAIGMWRFARSQRPPLRRL